MSQHKLTLSMTMGKRKKSPLPWILGGIVVLLAVLCVFALSGGEDDTMVTESDPIDLDALGMQEWSDLSELTRQSMEFDVVPDEPVPTPDNADPFLIKGRITRNQTLFVALKNHGLDIGDIQQVIASMENVVNFKRTKPGDRYEVHLDVDKRIVKFIYEISAEDISIAERDGNEFVAHKVDVHKKTERKLVKGELTSSLYQAFLDLGESGELASHFMQLFKYDIDFGTNSQRGDTFSVLVDRVTLNGEFYRYGRVWAATYQSNALGKTLEAYYFESDEEYTGYYNAEGRGLKRNFLKTPVIGCKVSSPYNPKRLHPIFKTIRPHRGIDWSCNTGTPIYAFADGVVTFAGWKGGNGNLLVIEHPHGYTSLYAHLYAFGIGIKKGAKVRQGQIVAQVGNTGNSTGPHLHFGVKINGEYVDPAKIDTHFSLELSGNRLHAFQQKRDKTRLAMSGQPGTVEIVQDSN